LSLRIHVHHLVEVKNLSVHSAVITVPPCKGTILLLTSHLFIRVKKLCAFPGQVIAEARRIQEARLKAKVRKIANCIFFDRCSEGHTMSQALRR